MSAFSRKWMKRFSVPIHTCFTKPCARGNNGAVTVEVMSFLQGHKIFFVEGRHTIGCRLKIIKQHDFWDFQRTGKFKDVHIPAQVGKLYAAIDNRSRHSKTQSFRLLGKFVEK